LQRVVVVVTGTDVVVEDTTVVVDVEEVTVVVVETGASVVVVTVAVKQPAASAPARIFADTTGPNIRSMFATPPPHKWQ